MTREWEKHRKFLMTGHWHIHTTFTDGDSSVMEYSQKAADLHIPLIAFTEHVRKDLTYDFNEFLEQINTARQTFSELVILSGCEAKVLPDGLLDCPQWILDKTDYRLFAFHSFPADVEVYFSALCKVIQSGRCDAWAHPGIFFNENPTLFLPDEKLKAIFRLIESDNILVERNTKYHLPPLRWLEIIERMAANIQFVYGGDVHNIEMLSVPDNSFTSAENKIWKK